MKEKLIMVVKKELLFGTDYFEGFRPCNEIDYETRILNSFIFMPRSYAELDPSYKQPISYAVLINPSLKQVFAYQRSKCNYDEPRLQGKWSWGIGGHIEQSDLTTKASNPIRASLLRELEEEVQVDGPIELKLLGYINNDSDDVGKVHFGLLYLAETASKLIKPKDPEIEHGSLKTLKQLEEISLAFSVEEWSKIALEPLRGYLEDKLLNKKDKAK